MLNGIVSISEGTCSENGFLVNCISRRGEITTEIYRILKGCGISISQIDLDHVTGVEAISSNRKISYIVFRLGQLEIEARKNANMGGNWESRIKGGNEIRLGI